MLELAVRNIAERLSVLEPAGLIEEEMGYEDRLHHRGRQWNLCGPPARPSEVVGHGSTAAVGRRAVR